MNLWKRRRKSDVLSLWNDGLLEEFNKLAENAYHLCIVDFLRSKRNGCNRYCLPDRRQITYLQTPCCGASDAVSYP